MGPASPDAMTALLLSSAQTTTTRSSRFILFLFAPFTPPIKFLGSRRPRAYHKPTDIAAPLWAVGIRD